MLKTVVAPIIVGLIAFLILVPLIIFTGRYLLYIAGIAAYLLLSFWVGSCILEALK